MQTHNHFKSVIIVNCSPTFVNLLVKKDGILNCSGVRVENVPVAILFTIGIVLGDVPRWYNCGFLLQSTKLSTKNKTKIGTI